MRTKEEVPGRIYQERSKAKGNPLIVGSMKRKGMTHCKIHCLAMGYCGTGATIFVTRRLNGRRAKLRHLCGDKILFSESFDLDGPIVFAEACRLGVEGIVSKRVGSRYVLGQSDAWVKTLNTVYDR